MVSLLRNNMKPQGGRTMLRLKTLLFGLALFAGFSSCQKKQIPERKDLYIKFVNNDSLGIYRDNTIAEIISLHDNTFWIHYRLNNAQPLIDKFERYDDDFNLLNSAVFNHYRFGKFVVRGNNDIVVTAFHDGTSGNWGYHCLQFDNEMNITQVNDTLDDHFSFLSLSYNTFCEPLKNGNYVFGFFTTDGNPGSDSARMVTAAFRDPLKLSRPLWIDENVYPDPAQGIRNNAISGLSADDLGNFYVLGNTPQFAFTLRKHREDRSLIWQRKIPNTRRIGILHTSLHVESDRVIVVLPDDKIFLFDLNGNYVEKQLPYKISGKILPTLNGDGYIAASDTAYPSAKYATMLKFDKNFNLLKLKRYGNQGTNPSEESAPRLNRLASGKIVVSGFVEGTNLNKVNLFLFKIDDELELVD